jgi:2-polyprenyl-3-methyl-5-hydroxy-6-metoxy-1,4-benzoquinol methylase/GNAT superfamily N-acetyltransferase
VPITYEWIPGPFAKAKTDLLQDCASLYSSQYGRWAIDAPRNAGQPVRLSVERIRNWFKSPDSKIAFARHDGLLIGYAIAVRTKVPRYGVVTWVTQLVVHEEHRRSGVAKNLLFCLWSFSDHFAWGLVSANPFAVRALEKATRRRCNPRRLKKHQDMLLAVATEHVSYISNNTTTVIRDDASRINTKFFLDHSNLKTMIADATAHGTAWVLGDLESGWEWFAFTFNDQEPIKLTPEEIKSMIEASDQVVRQAYSRMTLDSGHSWSKHTPAETEFIVFHCDLKPGHNVLDLGCGTGRHALQLAEKKLRVTGVDYVPDFVAKAAEMAKNRNLRDVDFHEDDCRNVEFEERFKCVICLYDVIGSFAENRENFKIIRKIGQLLLPGGSALISVMNGVLTEKKGKASFLFEDGPKSAACITTESNDGEHRKRV